MILGRQACLYGFFCHKIFGHGDHDLCRPSQIVHDEIAFVGCGTEPDKDPPRSRVNFVHALDFDGFLFVVALVYADCIDLDRFGGDLAFEPDFVERRAGSVSPRGADRCNVVSTFDLLCPMCRTMPHTPARWPSSIL